MSSHADLVALHQRYAVQAEWTAENRQQLYLLARLSEAERVLEVGSGTGVITADLGLRTGGHVIGVELDRATTLFARALDPHTTFCTADGAQLPFGDGVFDATLCHFLLLWVDRPRAVLSEMRRVTAGSGAVLALAEPDYGARIDYPAELARLGQLQAQALSERGANLRIGRRLRELFIQVGLHEVRVGLLGGSWTGMPNEDWLRSEWNTLAADLTGQVSPRRLRELQRLDQKAWQEGTRILYVPTFFAMGVVPPDS